MLKLKEQKYHGLCMTCAEAPMCRNAQRAASPVVHCEQFELPANETRPVSRAATAADDDPSLKGLCRNCVNRASCGYAHTEAGVWHCEEYR